MTDPISDMLTRIRNAILVKKAEVFIPFSKTKLAIAKILEKENLVDKIRKEMFKIKGKKRKVAGIIITLKYEDGHSVIKKLKRISKPGCRIYIKNKEIKPQKYRFFIISTSQGIMTDREAKKRKLGGEVICEIW